MGPPLKAAENTPMPYGHTGRHTNASMGPPLKAAENIDADLWRLRRGVMLQWGRR